MVAQAQTQAQIGFVEEKVQSWVKEAPGKRLAVLIGLQYVNAILPILKRNYDSIIHFGREYVHGDLQVQEKKEEILKRLAEFDTVHVYVIGTGVPNIKPYLEVLAELLPKSGKLHSFKFIDVITYGEVIAPQEIAKKVVEELNARGLPSDMSWIDPKRSRIVTLLDVVEAYPFYQEKEIKTEGKIPVVLVSRHTSGSYFDIPKQDEEFKELFEVRGVVESLPSLPSDIAKWLDEIAKKYDTKNLAFAGTPDWINAVLNALGAKVFLPKTTVYRGGQIECDNDCKSVANGAIILRHEGWYEYVVPHTLSINWSKVEESAKEVVELTKELVEKYQKSSSS